MSKHALLSASSAYRWLACTPSAKLSEPYQNGRASDAAEEGTVAHKLAELKLQDFFQAAYDEGEVKKLKAVRKSSYYSQAMEDYVDEYVQIVLEAASTSRADLYTEVKVDFNKWVPDGFGTADAVVIADNVLQIFDLKYGKGIPVQAEGNPQLRLYALGVYDTKGWLYDDIKEVTVNIIQPRNGGWSKETIPIKDLLAWGESIKPIAKKAFKGEGETKAGEHCRFCPVAPRCRALKEYNTVDTSKTADLLTDEELAGVLGKADSVIKYANLIKDYCLNEALQGRHFAGWKLVEGRANRKYSDEAEIANVLQEAGFENTDVFQPAKLLSITTMQSFLGKKKFEKLLGDYIIKPQGKPVMVPESDPRPVFSSAENDFEALD